MGDAVEADSPTQSAPTQSAGTVEPETQSVYAWGMDDDDDLSPPRLTPRRITMAAVGASLAAVAVAGVLAWQQLRADEPAALEAMTPATTSAPSPVLPPPVTVTTVMVQPPPPVTVTQQAPPPSRESVDERFLANMRADGWTVSDPQLATSRAHQSCGMLQDGYNTGEVVQFLLSTTGGGPYDEDAIRQASNFVTTAMATYPNCP